MLWFCRYWENHHPLKIADLRQVLDKYSIFAGRNIFDLVVRCYLYNYDINRLLSFCFQSPYARSIANIHKQEHIHPHVNSNTKPDAPVSKCHNSVSAYRTYILFILSSDSHHKTYFCHSDLHTVKKYFHCTENLVPVPFMDQVQILEFDFTGREYKSSEHGITINIPEGAISQGEIVHMEVAVALYGPFQFSDGKRPISPILWLCPQEDVTFLKPITIILPHTMIDLSSDDAKKFGVSFAKADHRLTTVYDGKKKYVFKSFKQDATAAIGGSFATLEADHCCFWCLQRQSTSRHSSADGKEDGLLYLLH